MPADELRLRLRTELARAELYGDGPDPAPAVMLACDFLIAGIDGEAVVALAAESAARLSVHDARRRLEAMAEEVGVATPSTTDCVTLVAADTCRRILDGSLPPADGAHRLYVVGHEGSALTSWLPAVSDLADHLEDDLRGVAGDPFRDRLRALAARVLESAVRHMPGTTP